MKVCLPFLLMSVCVGSAVANPNCRAVNGVVRVNHQGGALTGTAEFTIEGVRHNAALTVRIVEAPRVEQDGVTRAHLSQVAVFGDGGTLSADGKIVLTREGGSSRGLWHARVVGGGPLAGSQGDITFQGEADFEKSQFAFSANGQLCGRGAR